MTLRHFETFMKVCEKLSMTAAAGELYLSRPAISKIIKEMETHYGVTLFVRVGNRLRLTPDGEALRARVGPLRKCSEDIETRRWISNRLPPVRLGFSDSAWYRFMPELRELWTLKLRNTDVLVHTYPSIKLEKLLQTNGLDLALMDGSVMPPLVLDEWPIGDDELVFVCAEGSRFVDAGSGGTLPYDRDMLYSLPFLLPASGQMALVDFQSVMWRHGIAFREGGLFHNTSALLSAVEMDMGVGVVSVHADLSGRRIKPFRIEGLDFRRKFNLVTLRATELTPETLDLIALIKERYQ